MYIKPPLGPTSIVVGPRTSVCVVESGGFDGVKTGEIAALLNCANVAGRFVHLRGFDREQALVPDECARKVFQDRYSEDMPMAAAPLSQPSHR